MKIFRLWLFVALCSYMGAKEIKVDFESNQKQFSAFVGKWYVKNHNGSKTYVVDGRKWLNGTMSAGVAQKAKALYGDRYAEFLDNLNAYKYFPLSIFKDTKNFTKGTISVRFKAISGNIDQAGGIAFDIRDNGDYLTVRANSLEDNLVAFKLKNGRRSSVKWVRNVPTPSKVWHTLKLNIDGNDVIGYLDGKKYLELKLNHKVKGKIGLWSKADSYVIFDDFRVTQ